MVKDRNNLIMALWTCIDCDRKFDEIQLDKENMICPFCKSRSIVRDE